MHLPELVDVIATVVIAVKLVVVVTDCILGVLVDVLDFSESKTKKNFIKIIQDEIGFFYRNLRFTLFKCLF